MNPIRIPLGNWTETIAGNGPGSVWAPRTGIELTPPILAAIAHAIAAEPELARMIVEAGRRNILATKNSDGSWNHKELCKPYVMNPHDMQPLHAATDLDPAKWAKASAAAGAKPVPVDVAPAVKESSTTAPSPETAADDEAAVHALAEGMQPNPGTLLGLAHHALAAIKADKVPGVSWSADTSADLHIAWKRGLEDGKALMRAERDRLKVDASNHAHDADTVRRERDNVLADLAAAKRNVEQAKAWRAVVACLNKHGVLLTAQPEERGMDAACGAIDRLFADIESLKATFASMTERAENISKHQMLCRDERDTARIDAALVEGEAR